VRVLDACGNAVTSGPSANGTDVALLPGALATDGTGRAAAVSRSSTKGLPDRPYWDSRPFPPQSYYAPAEEQPQKAKVERQREEAPAVYAPFGRVPALPGVDVPPPAPFARPREVITIQDDGSNDDNVITIRDNPPAPARPHSRRGGRRPRPMVIDVDADTIPEDENFPRPAAAIHRRRRSRTPRPDPAARDPNEPPPRLGRSIYDAVQTHGHFGMVDSGESDGGIRRLVVHVPKRSRGYILDIRPGEVIHANSARGRPVGGRLEVKFVTRHQYFAPGRPVTSCVIGVPDWQWQRFM
jgi:hypothetical protein